MKTLNWGWLPHIMGTCASLNCNFGGRKWSKFSSSVELSGVQTLFSVKGHSVLSLTILTRDVCIVVYCHVPWARCHCPWRRAGPPWRACDWGAAEQRSPQGDAQQGWSGCCPTRHCRRPTAPLLQPPSPTGCWFFKKHRSDTVDIVIIRYNDLH